MSDERPRDDLEPEIEIVEINEVVPIPRDRPTAGLREFGRRKSGDLDICINERVLAELSRHVATDTAQELGGLLVGNICIEGKQHWLDVADHIPALHTEAGGAHLKFTIETWASMDKALEERYPGGERVAVGWYHSHPNLGVFFSGADESVHRQFSSWWQVAVVIDPVKGDIAFFREIDGRIERVPGVAVYGEGDVREPFALNYDAVHREGVEGGSGEPRDADEEARARRMRADAPVTIDLTSPRKSGLGKLWISLVILALASLVFLVVALRSRPVPQGRSRAERIGTWIDKLHAAGALDSAKRGDLVARLKPDKDPKATERNLADVEKEVRTRVARVIGVTERALADWDDSFGAVGAVGDGRAAIALKDAWERSLSELERLVPSTGLEQGQGIDEEILGAELSRRQQALEAARGRIRIRVIGPSNALPIRTREIVVSGEIEGAGEDAVLTVNDASVPVRSGRFEHRLGLLSGDGDRTVQLKVARGAEAAERTVTYRLDQSPPQVVIDFPAKRPFVIDQPQITIIGRLIENDRASLMGPDGELETDERGYFRFAAHLASEGSKEFVFQAMDRAGNESARVRVSVTYTKPRPWEGPLSRAKEAHKRGDLRGAEKAFSEAMALDVPANQIPPDVQAAVERWRTPPTLVVTSPAEGAEIEGGPLEITGTLATTRDTDILFVDDVEVKRSDDGTFRVMYPRKVVGVTRIDIAVRDGNDVRRTVTRQVTFVDRSPVRVLYKAADAFAGELSQQNLARQFQVPVTIENFWGMKFRLLPPLASFVGSAKPVFLTYLQVTEMPQPQHDAVVRGFDVPNAGAPTLPAASVTKTDVEGLILTMHKLRSGEKKRLTYRLPTSDEWERAASLAALVPGFWLSLDGAAAAAKGANFADQPSVSALPELSKALQEGRLKPFAGGDQQLKAASTGSYPLNSLGYFDLLGNVWEWTSSKQLTVGGGAETYVVRGGSWKTGIEVADRFHSTRKPDAREEDLGYRLAVEVEVEFLKTLVAAPGGK